MFKNNKKELITNIQYKFQYDNVEKNVKNIHIIVTDNHFSMAKG